MALIFSRGFTLKDLAPGFSLDGVRHILVRRNRTFLPMIRSRARKVSSRNPTTSPYMFDFAWFEASWYPGWKRRFRILSTAEL